MRILLALLLTVAAASAAERVYPQYEGVNLNVYLTVTPTPRDETYGMDVFAVKAVDMQLGDLPATVAEPFLTRCRMIGLPVNAAETTADFIVDAALDPTVLPDKPESYTLIVSGGDAAVTATIRASSIKGIHHGFASLRQLTMGWQGKAITRTVEIRDYPGIPYRFVKRASGYWMEQATFYKLNGCSSQMSRGNDFGTGEAYLKLARAYRDAIREKHLYLHGMVSMGNRYEGSQEAIDAAAAGYVGLFKEGVSHLSIMNDDKMTLADKTARDRFGDYFGTQLAYLDAIEKALRQAGYRQHLGFMPNHYHGHAMPKADAAAYRGKLGDNTALFWAGDYIPGLPAHREHFREVMAQVDVRHFWYYTNWPQVSNPYFAPNFMPTRMHDFGDGEMVELVTISTTTAPNYIPVSFITMADRLWNAEDYNADQALRRATKEVVDPASFDAFYALFQYVASLAPTVNLETASPMYSSELPDVRRALIVQRAERMDALVVACLSTPFGQDEKVRPILEKMVGCKEGDLARLERDEQAFNEGVDARAVVCPRVTKAPTLDGVVDPEEWRGAAVLDGFTDLRGANTAPHQTHGYLMRDDTMLYVAIVCDESEMKDPAIIDPGEPYPVPFLDRHDGFTWWYDCVELFLDPGHDGREVTQLIVNHLAMKEVFRFDSVKYGYYGVENKRHGDLTVTGMANITPKSWLVEIAIPLGELGEPTGDWGLSLSRTRRLTKGSGMKYSTWSPLVWGFQDARSFGTMTFSP